MASIEAGTYARSELKTQAELEVRQKNPNEFVSDLDASTEDLIRRNLIEHYPGTDIVGEEHGGSQTNAYWCVDPIDGTANFLRGSPLWGVSIAYVIDGVTIVGVISLPALGLTVGATTLSPLLLNGSPHPTPPDTGIRVIALGENPYWPQIEVLERTFREREWGIAEYRSATVGLAFAALGYTDGYIERMTNIWDIAAGQLLCERAGLTVIQGTDETDSAPPKWIQAGTDAALSIAADAWH